MVVSVSVSFNFVSTFYELLDDFWWDKTEILLHGCCGDYRFLHYFVTDILYTFWIGGFVSFLVSMLA